MNNFLFYKLILVSGKEKESFCCFAFSVALCSSSHNKLTVSYTHLGDIKPGKGGSLLIAGCSGLAVFDKKSGDTQWHQTFGDISLNYPVR